MMPTKLMSLMIITAMALALATPTLGAAAPAPPGSQQVEQTVEPLFWSLPKRFARAGAPGPLEIEVEIHADGALVHEERMTVERPGPYQVGAIRLLAREPGKSEALVSMARRGNVELEAGFIVNGSFAETQPLHTLVGTPDTDLSTLRHLAQTYNEDAQAPEGEGLQKIVAKDLDCSERDACGSDCLELYQQCRETVCFPQIFCDQCDTQYNQCLQSCPDCECTDPRSVNHETDTYPIDFYPTGLTKCYEDLFENDFEEGWWYDEWTTVYQEDTIKVTTYCDGSTSEQVVETSYFYTYCYQETFLSCSFPFAWPPATC